MRYQIKLLTDPPLYYCGAPVKPGARVWQGRMARPVLYATPQRAAFRVGIIESHWRGPLPKEEVVIEEVAEL